MIPEDKSIGTLAAELPGAAQIFEKHRIDYCCGGKHPVREVCRERGIALEALVEEFERAAVTPPDGLEWNASPLRELMGHIILRHHTYLRSELPRIAELLDKGVAAGGNAAPVLAQIRQIFGALREELEAHMMKEERILFPVIGKLEAGAMDGVRARCGSIEHPIARMEQEHDGAGRALREIRELTSNYAIPDGTGSAYHGLFTALMSLESDLHRHMHLENNILFPRAAKLQNAA